MYDPRNPTPRRPNHPSPGNAFTPAFLDLLDPEDDPPTATEAVAEVPWTVVRVTAPKLPFAEPNGIDPTRAEPWAVVRDGGHPDDEPPAATFLHLHPARLATAALPIAARDTVYRLDREPDRAASRCARTAASSATCRGTTRSSSRCSTTSTSSPAPRGRSPRCSRRRGRRRWARVGALLARRSA